MIFLKMGSVMVRPCPSPLQPPPVGPFRCGQLRGIYHAIHPLFKMKMIIITEGGDAYGLDFELARYQPF